VVLVGTWHLSRPNQNKSTFKTYSKEDFNQIDRQEAHSGRDQARWERLPTEAVESPYLEMLKAWLEKALSILM